MEQRSNTNIDYIFEGTPIEEKYRKNLAGPTRKVTIHSYDKKELKKVMKTGQFTYSVPDMWPDKVWGYPQREPGYDIVCKVERVEKVTEVTTWTHEDITLEGLARDLQ